MKLTDAELARAVKDAVDAYNAHACTPKKGGSRVTWYTHYEERWWPLCALVKKAEAAGLVVDNWERGWIDPDADTLPTVWRPEVLLGECKHRAVDPRADEAMAAAIVQHIQDSRAWNRAFCDQRDRIKEVVESAISNAIAAGLSVSCPAKNDELWPMPTIRRLRPVAVGKSAA